MFLEPKVNFRPAERLWATPCCSLSSAASYINHLNKRFLAGRASVSGDVYSLPRHSARLKSFQRVTVPHRSDQEHPSEQLLSLGAAFWQIRWSCWSPKEPKCFRTGEQRVMLGRTDSFFSACYSDGGKATLNVLNCLSPERNHSVALVSPCERSDRIRWWKRCNCLLLAQQKWQPAVLPRASDNFLSHLFPSSWKPGGHWVSIHCVLFSIILPQEPYCEFLLQSCKVNFKSFLWLFFPSAIQQIKSNV